MSGPARRKAADAPELSVVIPVYGCADSLQRLHERLTKAVAGICTSWEFIFVDDRARDGSWEILEQLCTTDPHVIAVRFSRNFGQQIAISAGIERACGKMVAVMDCDLQDPPEAIPDLVKELGKGTDIVLARRTSKYQSKRRLWANRCYFFLLRLMTGARIDGEYGSLSIMSRKVADAYLRFTERDRHYLFIIFWLGFTVRTLQFERHSRAGAKSSYSYAGLLRLAVGGIFFQTARLLQWMVQFGFVCSLVGVIYGIYLVFNVVALRHEPPQGWTSVIVVLLFMSGVTITSIGIVGLYVARVFEQVKARPLYVVDLELRHSQAVPAAKEEPLVEPSAASR